MAAGALRIFTPLMATECLGPFVCGILLMETRGRSVQRLDRRTRHSGRNIHHCSATAADLFRRLRPHLPTHGRVAAVQQQPLAPRPPQPAGEEASTAAEQQLPAAAVGRPCCGLNEQLRFLRYGRGEFFAPHYDGVYPRPDGSACSELTVMVYLNGGGGEDFAGGTTRILPHPPPRDTGAMAAAAAGATALRDGERCLYEFEPARGDVLVFSHDILHEGAPVSWGCKYAVRTDVMFGYSCRTPSAVVAPPAQPASARSSPSAGARTISQVLASVRAELGFDESMRPKDVIANAVAKVGAGTPLQGAPPCCPRHLGMNTPTGYAAS
jgi:hypothetical protein